ncbi:MAG: TnpV protein [Selenomonadaceae bacterium]|nr:TnpV protein [Selenomonadaceae bacterium]
MTMKGEDIPYIGEWAELKKNYMLEEKPEDYDELESEHMLLEYLDGIETAYSKRFDELVERQMEFEGVDEEMKIENPLKWVGLVNNIRSQVREILTAELCS